MILDESTCKALLNKQHRVLTRRMKDLTPHKRKSRKAFIGNSIKALAHTSIIIGYHTDRNETLVTALDPHPTVVGQFEVVSNIINSKHFTLKTYGTIITFTQHFLVRMMQYYREPQLVEISQELNYVFTAIIEAKLCNADNGEYDLHVEDIGMLSIVMDEGYIYVKTIIGATSLKGGRADIQESLK